MIFERGAAVMPRGSKAVSAAKGHRTKAEISAREQAEQDMLSGKKLVEFPGVKGDPAAHEEFKRVAALMRAIGKDDALYSAAINRYAELFSEILRDRMEIQRLQKLMDELQEKFNETDPSSDDISKFAKNYSGMLMQADKLKNSIQTKRKMMGDIEKENCMTVQAALRSIPKETGKKDDSPLMKILSEV